MSKLKLRKANTATDERSEDLRNEGTSEEISDGSKIKLFSDIKLLKFPTDRKEKLDNAETTSKYFVNAQNSSLNDSGEFSTKKTAKKIIPNEFNDPLTRKKGNTRKRNKTTSKCNSLRKYTDDFQKICSNGGVDVDPDQLQLAIALSQSMVDHQREDSQANDSKTVNLKRTLEQFGFKVKSNCDNASNKKSYKYKCRNNYPLIETTLERKTEIVSNKISEILFDNVKKLTPPIESTYKIISNSLREIACVKNCCYEKSHVSYADMNDELYYVPNLIIPSDSKMGCLLKDWSTIPGREKSPDRITNKENLRDNPKFKNNVDILLSEPRLKILNLLNSESHFEKLTVTNCDRSESPDIFMDESFDNPPTVLQPDVINVLISSEEDNDDDELPDVYISQSKAKDLISEVIEINYENDAEPLQNSIVLKNHNESDEDIKICESNGIIHYESFCDLSFNKSANDEEDIIKNNSESSNLTIIDNDIKNSQTSVHSEFNISDKMMNFNDKSDTLELSDDDFNYSTNKPEARKSLQMLEEEIYDVKAHNSKNDIENVDIKENSTNDDFKNSQTSSVCSEFGISNKIPNSNDISDIFEISDDESNYSINKSKAFKSLKPDEENFDNVEIHNDKSMDNIENVDFKLASPNLILEENNFESSNLTIIENDDLKYSQTSTCSEFAISNKIESSKDNSDVFEISDDEFNYSMNKPKARKSLKILDEEIYDDNEANSASNIENVDFKKASSSEEASSNFNINPEKPVENDNYFNFTKMYRSSILNSVHTNSSINVDQTRVELTRDSLPDVHLQGCQDNVLNMNERELSCNQTPTLDKYIVKTGNVTPATDYNNYNTPDIIKELSKYGLKPLKRKRAIKILEHIYEQTHPLVDVTKLENERKRIKLDNEIASQSNKSSNDCEENSFDDLSDANENINPDINKQPESESNIYLPNTEDYALKSIDCDPDDWIFQTREKSKLHGCRVPLHIVFHNYICRRVKLREAILKYEPVDIEIIYKDFVANGFRCKPNDLMSFFDKKCITIKTKATRPKGRRRKNR